MEISQRALMWFILVAGALVLASYVVGLARASRPADIWGGITPTMQKAVVPFMLLAAAGFIAYASIVLFRLDAATFAALRWPWGASDGGGGGRLFLAFALFLIPSALWLEATLIHVRMPQPWSQALVVAVLFLVAVGVVLLGLLAFAAQADGVPGAVWLILGAVAIGIQVIINDLVIWVWKFPW